MGTDAFTVPEERELVEFFGVEASERSVEDGYWSYELEAPSGVVVRFSFDLYERSVQTELRVGDGTVVTVSHELAQALTIVGRTLRCEFSGREQATVLVLELEPRLQVNWSTLRT